MIFFTDPSLYFAMLRPAPGALSLLAVDAIVSYGVKFWFVLLLTLWILV